MNHIRTGYFFGYGADREPDMIEAIIGHKPKVVTTALIQDFELRVQDISEVKDTGKNPQAELLQSWGKKFFSYVIVPQKGAQVEGTVFKLTLHDRHLVDSWELVELGWYDRIFVTAYGTNGKTYRAETQILAGGQKASKKVDGMNYKSWLLPKQLFMHIAQIDFRNYMKRK